MASPTYATHMLDGLDLLYRKTDDALKSLVEILSFLKKISVLEKNHGSDLIKIAKRYASSKAVSEEIGTLRSGWDSMQQELENVGNKHVTLSDHISKDLCDSLTAYIKKKEVEQKKLVKDGQRITRDMKASIADLHNSKSKFSSACKQADSAAGSYSKAKAEGTLKPKELNKLNQKANKAADLANAADKEYQKQLEKTNQKQHHYYEQELPALLQSFQEFEEERIRFLKQQFERYATFNCQFPPFLDMSCKSVKRMVDEITVESDTQSFLDKHKTGISAPPDIQYESFTPQNDFVLSSSPSTPSPMSSRGPAPTPVSSPSGLSSSSSVAAAAASSSSSSSGGGNIVETNIPVSKEVEINKNVGLSTLDASLPAEFKHAKIKQQLKEVRENIRAERKTVKGIEKLIKFYAAEPAAQETTQHQLRERKEKLQQMREIQGQLEGDLQQLEAEMNPDSGRGGGGGSGHQEQQQQHVVHEDHGNHHHQQQYGDGYGTGGGGGGQEENYDASRERGDWESGEIVSEAGEYEEPVVIIRARGLYEYVATNDTELSFKEGDILGVTDQDDSGWWFAELGGRSGFVPKNYLEVLEE